MKIALIVATSFGVCAALFQFSALPGLGSGLIAPAHAQTAEKEWRAGPMKITGAWTRATPKGAKVGGGYLKITNTGAQADRLIGGEFPLAGKFEVHEMSMQGGMMKMRHLADGLEIKPGQTVELKPGGYHLMFMQLKDPIATGKPVKGTLVFQKAGSVEIEYVVAPIGSKEMPSGGGHMNH